MNAQVYQFPTDLPALYWSRGQKDKAAVQVAVEKGITASPRFVAMAGHPSVQSVDDLRGLADRIAARNS